nr:predicted GPI-anchored protein 58 [Aegilops tauschii subsp. strangulata]
MDSDDEEAFAALLEEEVDADAQDEERLMVLAALAGLFASNAKPRRGDSVPGRQKAKQRHRLEGYCLLYTDNFPDAPLHGEKFITAPIIRFPSRFLPKKKKPSINNEREREWERCQQSCKPLLHNASALSHATPPHSSVLALLYKPRRASPSLPHPHTAHSAGRGSEKRATKKPPKGLHNGRFSAHHPLRPRAPGRGRDRSGARSGPRGSAPGPASPAGDPAPGNGAPYPGACVPAPYRGPCARAPTVAPTPSATAPAPADSPMSSPPAPTPDMSPSPTAEPATPGSGAAGLSPAFVLAAAAVAIYAF